MSRDYLVIRAGRVVCVPGHYDLEGARAVVRLVLRQHPKGTVKIVKIVETRVSPKEPQT